MFEKSNVESLIYDRLQDILAQKKYVGKENQTFVILHQVSKKGSVMRVVDGIYYNSHERIAALQSARKELIKIGYEPADADKMLNELFNEKTGSLRGQYEKAVAGKYGSYSTEHPEITGDLELKKTGLRISHTVDEAQNMIKYEYTTPEAFFAIKDQFKKGGTIKFKNGKTFSVKGIYNDTGSRNTILELDSGRLLRVAKKETRISAANDSPTLFASSQRVLKQNGVPVVEIFEVAPEYVVVEKLTNSRNVSNLEEYLKIRETLDPLAREMMDKKLVEFAQKTKNVEYIADFQTEQLVYTDGTRGWVLADMADEVRVFDGNGNMTVFDGDAFHHLPEGMQDELIKSVRRARGQPDIQGYDDSYIRSSTGPLDSHGGMQRTIEAPTPNRSTEGVLVTSEGDITVISEANAYFAGLAGNQARIQKCSKRNSSKYSPLDQDKLLDVLHSVHLTGEIEEVRPGVFRPNAEKRDAIRKAKAELVRSGYDADDVEKIFSKLSHRDVMVLGNPVKKLPDMDVLIDPIATARFFDVEMNPHSNLYSLKDSLERIRDGVSGVVYAHLDDEVKILKFEKIDGKIKLTEIQNPNQTVSIESLPKMKPYQFVSMSGKKIETPKDPFSMYKGNAGYNSIKEIISDKARNYGKDIREILISDGITVEKIKKSPNLGSPGWDQEISKVKLYTTDHGEKFSIKMGDTEDLLHGKAAYIMSEELRLGLVPPTNVIEVEGSIFLVQRYISDALKKNIRLNDDVHIFDFLIGSVDRSPKNNALADLNGRVWLIDHEDAFAPFNIDEMYSYFSDPSDRNLGKRKFLAMVKSNHPFMEKMSAWSEADIKNDLVGLLSDQEFDALFKRRTYLIDQYHQMNQKNIVSILDKLKKDVLRNHPDLDPSVVDRAIADVQQTLDRYPSPMDQTVAMGHLQKAHTTGKIEFIDGKWVPDEAKKRALVEAQQELEKMGYSREDARFMIRRLSEPNVRMLGATEDVLEAVEIYRHAYTTPSKFAKDLENFENGGIISFKDGKTFKVKKIYDNSGANNAILELDDGRLLRVPKAKRDTYIDKPTAFVRAQAYLKSKGIPVVEIFEHGNDYVVVEKLANQYGISNYMEYLSARGDLSREVIELIDSRFFEFVEQTKNMEYIGVFHPRQLVYSDEKGWILVDFSEEAASYSGVGDATVFDRKFVQFVSSGEQRKIIESVQEARRSPYANAPVSSATAHPPIDYAGTLNNEFEGLNQDLEKILARKSEIVAPENILAHSEAIKKQIRRISHDMVVKVQGILNTRGIYSTVEIQNGRYALSIHLRPENEFYQLIERYFIKAGEHSPLPLRNGSSTSQVVKDELELIFDPVGLRDSHSGACVIGGNVVKFDLHTIANILSNRIGVIERHEMIHIEQAIRRKKGFSSKVYDQRFETTNEKGLGIQKPYDKDFSSEELRAYGDTLQRYSVGLRKGEHFEPSKVESFIQFTRLMNEMSRATLKNTKDVYQAILSKKATMNNGWIRHHKLDGSDLIEIKLEDGRNYYNEFIKSHDRALIDLMRNHGGDASHLYDQILFKIKQDLMNLNNIAYRNIFATNQLLNDLYRVHFPNSRQWAEIPDETIQIIGKSIEEHTQNVLAITKETHPGFRLGVEKMDDEYWKLTIHDKIEDPALAVSVKELPNISQTDAIHFHVHPRLQKLLDEAMQNHPTLKAFDQHQATLRVQNILYKNEYLLLDQEKAIGILEEAHKTGHSVISQNRLIPSEVKKRALVKARQDLEAMGYSKSDANYMVQYLADDKVRMLGTLRSVTSLNEATQFLKSTLNINVSDYFAKFGELNPEYHVVRFAQIIDRIQYVMGRSRLLQYFPNTQISDFSDLVRNVSDAAEGTKTFSGKFNQNDIFELMKTFGSNSDEKVFSIIDDIVGEGGYISPTIYSRKFDLDFDIQERLTPHQREILTVLQSNVDSGKSSLNGLSTHQIELLQDLIVGYEKKKHPVRLFSSVSMAKSELEKIRVMTG
ncbi:MAG: hypothetical protein R2877_01180, partial [Bdellovibrionota bacterium]